MVSIIYYEKAFQKEQYFKKLRANGDELSIGDVYDLQDESIRMSLLMKDLFSSEHTVYCFDAEKLLAPETNQEKIVSQELLSFLMNQPLAYPIYLVTTKLDRRRKEVKNLLSSKTFEDLSNVKLTKKMIESEVKIKVSNELFLYLSEHIENESIILKEIEKVALLENPATLETYKRMGYDYEKQHVFQLLDAFQKKEKERFQHQLNALLEFEEPVAILFLLLRSLKDLILIKDQSKRVPQNIGARKLSMHPYRYQLLLKDSMNFKKENLEILYYLLTEIDYKFKSGHSDIHLELSMLPFQLDT